MAEMNKHNPTGQGSAAPEHSGAVIMRKETFADIHSHIVPCVDDGAQSIKEAIELLRLDWEQGARVVFATPHYGSENIGAPDPDKILQGFSELTEAAKEVLPGLRILLGTEWYCSENIVDRIRNREASPMGDSGWYMVEFLEYGEVTEPADDILRRLKNMADNGIKTILAHAERYQAIQQDWNLAKQICNLGVRLQVNAYDLFLNTNEATRSLAQWMAEERLISFIGSDMHGTREGKRSPKMPEGIRWLYAHTDRAYADAVLRKNAEKYLGAGTIPELPFSYTV